MFNKSLDRFCELHVHLEGCVWAEHIEKWWDRSKYLFPPPHFQPRGKQSFSDFLSYIRFGYNFLNTAEAYGEVAALYAKQAVTESICYAEIQINYALLNTWGINLIDALIEINTHCYSIPSAPVMRFVIDLPWQFNAQELLVLIDKTSEIWPLGVRGISMGGDEAYARPKEVKKVFDEARRAGLKALCHAGETTSYDVAKNIVETLEPDRITHGISLSDWIETSGTYSPPIDVCLSSNLLLGVIDNLSDHPLNRWIKSGVPLSLSTDDPAIFRTTLEKEFRLANKICPNYLDEPDIICKNWIESAIDKKAVTDALYLPRQLNSTKIELR